MKLVIDVNDSKAKLLLDFLKTLTYVRVEEEHEAEEVLADKDVIVTNMKEAVREMKLVKAGKLKGRDAMDFLNEL